MHVASRAAIALRATLGLGLLGVSIAGCGRSAESPIEAAPAAAARIIDTPNGWSPDGSRILFTRYFGGGHADVFLVAADGSSLERVTDLPGKDENGSFTPDGCFLTYCSDREGQEEIYRLSLASGEVENLTRHPADECEYAWSHGGDRLVFHSDRDGDRNVFLMTLEGSSVERLTTAPGWDHVAWGAWSPDDRTIVYCSTGRTPFVDKIPGRLDPFGLYLLDLDGDRVPRLLLDQPGEDSYPAWSPDGREVCFAHKAPLGADDGAGYDIYRVAPDGSGADLFIGGPGDQYLPFWSPDGGTIAYFSTGSVWLADRDGGNRRRLEMPERAVRPFEPRTSPRCRRR